METADDNISQCSDESLVLIRINVPDLGVQKCMQFHRDELVWDVKQQVLAALPKEMKESFNCGLYCPPLNGRAGKFLDEERPLLDYPFPGPIGYLELKYKRRVYKMMNLDEKQIKQLHTRANLRRLLDFVQGGQAEKITKLCAKGLDPNFHCHETGETPLSIASSQRKCNKVILALANGGALLDYRTRDGVTSLHRAVEKNNLEAIKTLLDLGASPNYRDNKGLTPLYYSVLYNADSHICELLLHDHAAIGAADLQGWQEVHQACRNGLVQHLEHLLFYGADMNARNASGNTPLHVCAVNEQESCARVLLFRGTDKEALNYANQTPYQVAVIAGNLALAEVINNHRAEDVVPFREPPKYNPKRRASIASSSALNRTHSDPRLEVTLGIKPPSPSPSNRSLPPFSSASSLSETSTGSSSTCTQPSNSEEDSEDTASVSVITEKSVASDSSGVCVTVCPSGGYESYPERPAPMDVPLVPGLMCVCLENYTSDQSDHLVLTQGDIIEVTGSTDCGLLEGIFRGQRGYFPASCVQEVKLRHPELRCPARRVEGRREAGVRQQHNNNNNQQQPRAQANSPLAEWKRLGEPRTVVLHKGKKGFGFVLRGAKATSPLMELQPCENCPALQYLDDVDKGGVADLAGLKKGDFLLAINGENVTQASHEHVVNLIRKSGELVAMNVVTIQRPAGFLLERPQSLAARQCATLPRKLMRGKAAPVPPRRDPKTTLSVGRARARSMVAGLAEIEALDRTLLEYDSEGRSTKSSSIESLPNKQLKASDSLPHRKGSLNAHVRLSARRVVAANPETHDAAVAQPEDVAADGHHSPKVYGSVAQMKRHKASKHRLGDSPSKIHKVFHSTPELVPGGNVVLLQGARDSRRSHSQEDVAVMQRNGRNAHLTWLSSKAPTAALAEGPWHSIEEIYNRVVLESSGADGVHPPPPTHPPPPPPVGQVVRVDVSRSMGEYAKVTVTAADVPAKSSSVMSSFRPGDSAKLYASPQEIGIIGYHTPARTQPPPPPKPVSTASLRSRSLPPNVPPPPKTSSPSSSTSSETSGDSASYTCTTFKKPVPGGVVGVAPDAVSTDSGHSSERGSQLSGVQPTPGTAAAAAVSPYAQPVVAHRHHSYGAQECELRSRLHAEVVEPYIPEPDYDVSDDEDALRPPPLPEEPSLPPPPPPPPPPPLPPPKTSSQVVERKKPPTPPVKRRDRVSVGTDAGQATTVIRIGSPAGSPATVVKVTTTVARSKEAPPVMGKPPLSGAKIVKACSAPVAVTSSSPPVNRSDAIDPSDFKELIAKKAADRHRRASLSPDSPKTELNSDSPPPSSPALAAAVAGPEASESGTESAPKEAEMMINVKEQISAFEKKVMTPPSVARTVKRPEESRKILKGSHSQIFEAKVLEKVQLKPSKSCPHDLTQDQDGDNSSSGVSSDVDVPNSPGRAAAAMPPGANDDSDDSDDMNDGAWNLKAKITETSTEVLRAEESAGGSRRMLTRNAVSLARLPPPIETGETDAESDITEPTPPAESLPSGDDDSSGPSSPDVAVPHRPPPPPLPSGSVASRVAVTLMARDRKDEDGIRQSMSLIEMHASSLKVVNRLAGLVPPPPEFDGAAAAAAAAASADCTIAPPPEFSDDVHVPIKKDRRMDEAARSAAAALAAAASGIHVTCPAAKHPMVRPLVGVVRRTHSMTARLPTAPPPVRQVLRPSSACNGVPPDDDYLYHHHLPPQPPLAESGSYFGSLLKRPAAATAHAPPPTHPAPLPQKEFRVKPMSQWSTRDVSDWLESLLLPEYKERFEAAGVDGRRLSYLDNNSLAELGVKRVGHRMNIERSLRRHAMMKQ